MDSFNSYSYYPYNPEVIKNIERRELRAHGKRVGLCLLAYVLLQQLFLVLMSAFGLYESFLNNPLFEYSVSALVFSFLCLFVPFFAASKKQGFPGYWKVLPFNPPEKKAKAVLLVLVCFAACLSANYIASFVEAVLSSVGIEEYEPPVSESASAADVLLSFVCSAVSAPLIEEFVFRGVIMQPLRRYGEHFAVFASAVIFGLAHSSPTGFVFAFVAGVVIGYAVILSNSLWVGIAIHFCNNFYSVLASELYNAYPDLGSGIVFALMLAVMLAGLAALVLLVVKKEIRFQRSGSMLKTGAKIKSFFWSLPMAAALAAFVYYLLQSVMS